MRLGLFMLAGLFRKLGLCYRKVGCCRGRGILHRLNADLHYFTHYFIHYWRPSRAGYLLRGHSIR